ncbi:response regulator transcription factor [bacterium]|nr:MAG: response regulator transcription factor [bacterium]
MRILIIEDDARLARFLKTGLTQDGFAVDVAGDGESALVEFGVNSYDLVILDWKLPGMNGIAVCKEIRKRASHVPILFLTAQDSINNKVEGLESGADDYLTKPFSFMELAARLQALLRRRYSPLETFEIDDLVLNVQERKVTRGGKRIELSNKEFAILEFFMRNRNRLITHAALSNHVWEIDFDTGTNVIYVYVTQLRNKLNCGSRRPLIHTVRGAGYIFKEPEEL